MKQFLGLILVVLVIWSCQQEVNVYVTIEPGSIAGKVLPLGIDAFVELYQGELFEIVLTDDNGYFIFVDVAPGTYILRAKADNFGTAERTVHITDGEGNDVGTIELSQYPYPLVGVEPFNGATEVSNYLNGARIRLIFSKVINIPSLEEAFQIEPDVEDLTFSYYIRGSSSVVIEGNFQYGTEYSFTLDSTVTTQWGEALEFPYYSTFTTEDFKVTGYYPSYSYSIDSYYYVRFAFNSLLSNVIFLDYLTIEPETDAFITYPYGHGDEIMVTPSPSWRPDTTYLFTIDKDLPEIGGVTLKSDTSFS